MRGAGGAPRVLGKTLTGSDWLFVVLTLFCRFLYSVAYSLLPAPFLLHAPFSHDTDLLEKAGHCHL